LGEGSATDRKLVACPALTPTLSRGEREQDCYLSCTSTLLRSAWFISFTVGFWPGAAVVWPVVAGGAALGTEVCSGPRLGRAWAAEPGTGRRARLRGGGQARQHGEGEKRDRDPHGPCFPLSRKLVADRQAADALAGGGEDRVAQRRRKWRHPGGPCCTDQRCGRSYPSPVWFQAMRTQIGRPNSSMWLRAWTATLISEARRSSVRERSPSPITCLNLPMAASARARIV